MMNLAQRLDCAKEYLAAQLDLAAAYLFGSVAEGVNHPLSDVDIALLMDPRLSLEQRFARRLEIAGALQRYFQALDLVILNDAPPALQFQIIQKGQVLVDNDKEQRCLFQMGACNAYFDLKPYLDYYNLQMVTRIKEAGLGAGYSGHRDALAEARRLPEKLKAISEHSAG
jgi:predicted nucleotidyltransferase